ncbi:RNA polymerase II elongation factor [Mortierella sp. AM989]|nr:RNA polymerase II elongation factor [Mortierella sp. AM989]
MGSSNVEKDLLDLKKSLQDAQTKGSTSQIIDLLKQLEKYTVTASILRKTEMGLFVNKMKTHTNNDVSRMAKDIVKNWKTQVTKEASSSSSSSSTTSRPTVNTKSANDQHKSGSREGSSTASSPRTPTDFPRDRTIRSDGIRIKTTGNNVRDKCIEMLYQALGTNSNAESDRLLSKSTAIESIVFKKLSPDDSPSQNYRAKIRSFFMNLRDKSNPKLREAVVDGEVAVEDFCEYTTQDMASAEAKARDRDIQLQNMFLAKGAEEQQAETDMFKCGKCKGRKTRYYQMQTRSADEPMTTFVTCIGCGNRWKFS